MSETEVLRVVTYRTDEPRWQAMFGLGYDLGSDHGQRWWLTLTLAGRAVHVSRVDDTERGDRVPAILWGVMYDHDGALWYWATPDPAYEGSNA